MDHNRLTTQPDISGTRTRIVFDVFWLFQRLGKEEILQNFLPDGYLSVKLLPWKQWPGVGPI